MEAQRESTAAVSSAGRSTSHTAGILPKRRSSTMSERKTPGAMTGTAKPSAGHATQGQQKAPSKYEKKNNVPQDFDIDMDDPETQRAAVAIQSQFRKFQKKKQDVKS
ncbi:calmodulin regulator protein PCP4-like isoform X1 [Poeciliopsis prolifica]|uniref:calmodulin regulator protein PCP4-like isoform X1 n=1 Tax=Poeciliopsis prolifica TaxID=188132 RepID=UPI002413266D|nr:calmodulin regulator protein PCP4-like isoform X1 [Poeciliopsis prolifica]